MDKNAIVVGAGFFGATVARILAENGWKVEVVESRDFIGGNCHSHFEDGIEVHDYGPHTFHTNNEDVWGFVNRFSAFTQFEQHTVALHGGVPYFLPFGMSLICKFFGLRGSDATPDGVRRFMETVKVKNDSPSNVEEQAMASIGKELYNAFVRDFTKKKWNKDPKELPAYILKRIPVRYDFNINYFNDVHQGMPAEGFTKMFENMLDHGKISVSLGDFYDRKRLDADIERGKTVVYTGAIDELMDYEIGELEWRSLKFETKKFEMKDFQGISIVNYVDSDVPCTRTVEFKHFHPELKDIMKLDKTIVQYEYPDDWKQGNDMFYPIDDNHNRETWQKYAAQLNYLYGGKLFLGGRLGLYRYLDMDKSIELAISTSNNIMNGETQNVL